MNRLIPTSLRHRSLLIACTLSFLTLITGIFNSATASRSTLDPAPGNNSRSASTNVIPTLALIVNDAGDAADINVGNGVCDTSAAPGEQCTLRAAIQEANSNVAPDTIGFDPALNGSNITLNSALAAISGNLIINGPGATLLTVKRSPAGGTPNFRIFTINSGRTVSISGLTITNGRTADGSPASPFSGQGGNGGGIFNAGMLTLTNAVLTGNRTGNGAAASSSIISFAGQGGNGGGIFSSGTLTIQDVVVTGNSTGNGGVAPNAISNYGGSGGDGAGVYSSGVLTMTDVTVSNNTAGNGGSGGNGGGGGSGGGVAHLGTLTMSHCVVSGNMTGQGAAGSNAGASSGSSGWGGGIHGVFSGGTLNLSDSMISGNRTADGNSMGSGSSGGIGAGIVINYLGTGRIMNSTVTDNHTGSGLTPVAQGGFGGGIYNGGTLDVIGTTISGNDTGASSNFGGSLGGGVENDGPLTMTNCTVSGNRTGGIGGYGGGIVNNRMMTLVNVTVTNNTSFANVGHGVSHFSIFATSHIKNSIVAGNGHGLTGSDISGDYNSEGYNLIGNADNSTGFNATGDKTGNSASPVDPKLASLGNNGGPTMTHALLAGSPALDAGNNAFVTDPPFTGPTFNDQRGPGFLRIRDSADANTTPTVDIGAFEADPSVEDISDKVTNEDTALPTFIFNVGDGATPFTSISATSDNQALVPNANIVIGPDTVSTRTLSITPAANQFGMVTITVTVTKGTQSMSDTFLLTVNGVNDPPSFTKGPNQTVAEDSGAQKGPNWATSISPGPSNESGQTVTFLVQNNSNPGLFSAGPAISPTGALSYTPAPNANGSATITIALMDNGGGTNTSASQTFVITVTEVNDAPTAVGETISNVAEDSGQQTILASTLTANDSKGPANESGQTLIIKIVGNPAGGTVSLLGGNVLFNPAADYHGPASFDYTVEDNGTTNGVAAPLPSGTATASFVITEVNDAPTAVNDVLPNIAEDSGPRTILASTLLANDSKGPLNESSQAFIVKTVSNAEGGTVAIVNGDIIFTPTPNYNGPAIFSYTIEDNGTSNGGADPKTSLPGVVQFNITAVADTPSVTNATTNANTQTTSGLVISRNPADGAEVTHFKITGISGGSLFKNDGVTPINNGNFITFAEGNAGLKFTPGNVNGSFLVQASLSASDAGLGGGTVQANIIINPLGGVIRFSSGSYSVGEGDGFKTITVERSGDTSQAVTVDYASSDHSTPADFIPCAAAGAGHASSRCDFTTAIGTLRFAAGETSKTFNVLVSDDNYVEGTETLDLTLSNPTNGAVFGVPQTAILSITDDASEPATNPIDISGEFVSQQYHDMLNREPDPPGLAFWTDNIEKCNDPARRPAGQTAAQCIDKQRESTAIAFFVSPEFQMGGGFVYHLYKGSLTGVPNYDGGSPGRFPTFLEFISDMSQVSEGIVVNNQISGAVVEANRNRLAAAFVLRPEFMAKYGGLNNTLYVDELFNTTGITPTAGEKQALVDGLTGGTETRASVLRKVVDGTVVISESNVQFTTTYGQAFINQENRRLFVFMEYIGYLRRNPDAAGFNHWLGKLNFFNGDPFQAEMVRAFILSPEYRSRFGQP